MYMLHLLYSFIYGSLYLKFKQKLSCRDCIAEEMTSGYQNCLRHVIYLFGKDLIPPDHFIPFKVSCLEFWSGTVRMRAG